MRNSVAEAWPVFCERWEGRCSWMYLDVKGLVTTGTGNLIDSVAAAQHLPWSNVDGSPASNAVVENEWHRVKALTSLKSKGGYAYQAGARLHLSGATMDKLLTDKTAEFWTRLTQTLPDLESWPADAQLAILDEAWQNGPAFLDLKATFGGYLWAGTRRNALAQDFAAAAGNVPGTGARADARKGLFRTAGEVVRIQADPAKLWYPEAPTLTTPTRLLVLNAQYPTFVHDTATLPWDQRVTLLAALIVRFDATLVAVQEIGKAQAAGLAKLLGVRWRYDRAPGTDRNEGLNAVFWRDEWKWITSHSWNLPSFGQWQRTAIAAHLTGTSGQVWLVSSHFAAQASDLSRTDADKAKLAQVQHLSGQLVSLGDVVLGADLPRTDSADDEAWLTGQGWTLTGRDSATPETVLSRGRIVASAPQTVATGAACDHDGRLVTLTAVPAPPPPPIVPPPPVVDPTPPIVVVPPVVAAPPPPKEQPLSTTKRVRWKTTGHYVDQRTHAQLVEVERILGHPIIMWQGSWSNNRLSAGTHSASGAADIGPTGPVTWRQLEAACRKVGLACYFRPWTNNYHCHNISMGNPNVAWLAGMQQSAYKAGYDGLGKNARGGYDTGTRSYVGVTWESYSKQHPTVQEEDVLKGMKFSTTKDQKLAQADKYQYLKINDAGDVSFATGPCKMIGGVLNLRLKNLKPGKSVYVRIVEDDVDSRGRTRRAHTAGEMVEVPGTTGTTFVSVPFNGWPGAAPKGSTRRVRFIWSAHDTAVTIDRASVGYERG